MKKLTFLFALLCTSMLGWATPATYTGAGFSGAINGYSYDIDYSITYDDEHHLTFNVTLDGSFKETAGFVFEVWSSDLSSGNFKSFVHGEGNSWSVTDDAKDYSSMSGQVLNQLRLRLASSVGGTDQLYMSDYTVGLSGSAVIEGPTSRATTPSAPANKTKVITSWYYGKSCNFTDWGGGTSSQNTRLGKKLTCSRAEGNGWLGLVDFGDLDCSGMDILHMDIWVENNATLRATPIHYAYGEEYRHSISLTGGQWNSIELNLDATDFVSDGGLGAPDDYWDVINQFKFDLLANGLEFWIDNLYFYSNQIPVFTSISITGNTICQVGQNMSLTIETLDQFGQHIDAEYTCSVSPVSTGSVVGTTYTASAKGNATITVTSGLISNTLTVFNYEGSNLALNHLVNQSAEFSGYGAARAVDGNDGTEWQGSSTNGTAADEAARTYDCWFTVDLSGGSGDKYDVDLVTIKFEGACSDAYHIDFSTDGVSWEIGYSFAQIMGVNGHTDYITSFTNNSGVQYVRFWSTKASSQWGMKIFEFQVFGTEAASPTKSVSATPNNVSYGTATVKQNGVVVNSVTTDSEVTFYAVANDGYDFFNWTQGGVEVATSTEYTTTITNNTSLVANFEAHRTAYCSTPVTTMQGETLYLSITNPSANTYKILLEGSENNKIASAYNNFSFSLTHINGENGTTSLPAASWTTDDAGYGSAYVTFTASNFRDITFVNHYVVFNKQGGGLTEFNAFPDVNLIKWDATCTDDEAPVLAAPVATPLSGTSVRLALSATDNMAALLTYAINYKPAGSDGAGTDVEVAGTAGETTYKNIKGLAAGTRYQFSVTASDGTNVSDAQICYATPSMPTAPVPTHNADLVRSVYSDKYESALEHDFQKDSWHGHDLTYAEASIGGDHSLIYDLVPYNQDAWFSWGAVSGENAIEAKTEFTDGENTGLDASEQDYLHIDMMSANAAPYVEVQIMDVKLGDLPLNGSGWQSFDLPLATYKAANAAKIANIHHMKFAGFRGPNNPEEIAIDNVYFWRYGAKASADSWGTFASPVAVKVPSGVTVYKAVYEKNGDDETLTLTDAGSVIPANTGVLLSMADASASYAFTLATSDEATVAADNFEGNSLVGCATRTDISTVAATNDIFCLRRSDQFGMSGFFLYTGQYIPAGKAYLPVPKDGGTPAPSRRIRFVYDTATAIDNSAEAVHATKFIEDGQLFIRRGDAVYTIQGIRVE